MEEVDIMKISKFGGVASPAGGKTQVSEEGLRGWCWCLRNWGKVPCSQPRVLCGLIMVWREQGCNGDYSRVLEIVNRNQLLLAEEPVPGEETLLEKYSGKTKPNSNREQTGQNKSLLPSRASRIPLTPLLAEPQRIGSRDVLGQVWTSGMQSRVDKCLNLRNKLAGALRPPLEFKTNESTFVT